MVDGLKSSIAGALAEEQRFLPTLAANALASRPASSSFRRLVADLTRGDRRLLDLKRQGTRPLVDVARLFAMQLGYLDSSNTVARYRYAARALPEMARSADGALEAYRYLSELRFRLHLRAVERGEAPDNLVAPHNFNQTQRSMLEAVFATVSEVQSTVAHRYGVDPRM